MRGNNFAGGATKTKNISNEQLARKIHKAIIRKYRQYLGC